VQLQQSQPNGQEARVNVWASTQLLGPQINGSDGHSHHFQVPNGTLRPKSCVWFRSIWALPFSSAPRRSGRRSWRPLIRVTHFWPVDLLPGRVKRLPTLTGGPRTLPLSTPQHAAGPASCLAALHCTASSIISIPPLVFQTYSVSACHGVMRQAG
jgi:hypothetical protein